LFAGLIHANQGFKPFETNGISGYDNLTRVQPHDKHFEKGMEYLKSKKYEEAINEFDKSIKLNAKNGNAYKQRGIAKAELVEQCSMYNAKREEGTPAKKPLFSKDSAKEDLKKAKEFGCDTDKETLFWLGIRPEEI
jgi:tetratricopeptide (TPR) repeat protein